MKFEFDSKIGPWDFWEITMRKTYSSPVGLVNIVFTFAMVALTVRFFNSVNDIVQVLLVLLCLIFPLFQPIFVYLKAKGQVAMIPADLHLTIGEDGILVNAKNQSEKIKWNKVHGLIEDPTMLIIKVDGGYGYFLTNRTLKKERDELATFIKSKIK